jgi:predicted dienelactone hydrolase
VLGNLFRNLKELPKPLGKYIVGIMQLDFTDRSRTKVFPFEKDNAHRKIPVTIFYPAESNGGKDSAPYSSPELLEVLSKMTFGLVSKNVAKVKTNCYENVPIAVNEDKYPVIIFNHGYGSYTMQSTVLCSDLASSGYVVVSVGHPYESSGIKYLDGSVIKMPKIIQKNVQNSSLLETYKHLRKVLKASTKEYYSDSQAMQLSEQFLENYQELNKNVKIWVDDSIFIAEQLEALNKGETKSIFRNKLKLDLGIGITGHSYGGATAAQACLTDRRFVAGINIDGASCGEFSYKDIKKPFMLLGTHLIKNISRTTYIYNTEDTYMVILDNTQHLGYSDGLFIFRQGNIINQIGGREKYEFREIVTNCHLKFFEKYLLGNQEVELKDLRYNGFEFRQRLSKN